MEDLGLQALVRPHLESFNFAVEKNGALVSPSENHRAVLGWENVFPFDFMDPFVTKPVGWCGVCVGGSREGVPGPDPGSGGSCSGMSMSVISFSSIISSLFCFPSFESSQNSGNVFLSSLFYFLLSSGRRDGLHALLHFAPRHPLPLSFCLFFFSFRWNEHFLDFLMSRNPEICLLYQMIP